MTKKSQKQIIAELLHGLTELELVSLKTKLEAVEDLHDDMANSYFYTPPKISIKRRLYEEKKSNSCEFTLGSVEYKVEQKTNCSCNNVYYYMEIISSEKVVFNLNISFIKKILDGIYGELNLLRAM